MRALVAGFVVGVVWLQQQSSLPSFLLLAGIFALSMLVGLAVRRIRSKVPNALSRFMCGALFGIAWASLFATYYLSESLSKAWEGRDVTVVGTVDSLPHDFKRGVRFHFKVEQLVSPDATGGDIPSRLALSWYAGYGAIARHSRPDVHPGERWQLTVRLKRPHGDANPYGFDYEAWLLGQRLRATGYVRPDKKLQHKNRRLESFIFSPRAALGRFRGWLRERIYAALPDKPYAGMIAALVMGDQRAISHGYY